jgi:heme exporter protein C
MMKLRVLGFLTFATLIIALYMIFIFAPTETTQRDAQRIFYIHVPLAVVGAYGSAILLFIGCVAFLISGNLQWDRFAATSAEMGVVFTAAQLLTAMMWAKPIWGAWYAFDARGTAQVILLLIFIAYFMLRSYLPDREKRAKLCGVFGLLGMVDVPINYFAIYLFRTQHPQPVISPGGGGVDPDMAKTLLMSFIAITLLYVYLFVRRLKLAALEEDVDYLTQVVVAHEQY